MYSPLNAPLRSSSSSDGGDARPQQLTPRWGWTYKHHRSGRCPGNDLFRIYASVWFKTESYQPPRPRSRHVCRIWWLVDRVEACLHTQFLTAEHSIIWSNPAVIPVTFSLYKSWQIVIVSFIATFSVRIMFVSNIIYEGRFCFSKYRIQTFLCKLYIIFCEKLYCIVIRVHWRWDYVFTFMSPTSWCCQVPCVAAVRIIISVWSLRGRIESEPELFTQWCFIEQHIQKEPVTVRVSVRNPVRLLTVCNFLIQLVTLKWTQLWFKDGTKGLCPEPTYCVWVGQFGVIVLPPAAYFTLRDCVRVDVSNSGSCQPTPSLVFCGLVPVFPLMMSRCDESGCWPQCSLWDPFFLWNNAPLSRSGGNKAEDAPDKENHMNMNVYLNWSCCAAFEPRCGFLASWNFYFRPGWRLCFHLHL